MRIFQPKYKDKATGKTKKLQHWYIGFTDNQRVRRRLPGFPNKAATERATVWLKELLSCGGNLSAALQKWLEEIPDAMRDRLSEWNLIDSRKWSTTLGKSLSEHLVDFCAGLRADGRTDSYVRQTESAIQHILDGCNLKAWSDIDGNRVKVFLAEGRGPNGYGQRTYNSYLVAFKGFCSWLCREGRVSGESPMRAHGRIKQTEFEKQRRALTADEVRRLLEATQNGIRHHKMQPYARYLLYRLALETGLRMGEIRSLTVSSFDFRAKPPTVHVEPADTKGKEPADMILSPGTAQALQEHLQGKEPQDRAFRMPPSRHTVDMLKKDLEAAGVPYSLNGKDADCHSLRHTFITNLCLAGVHPAVAQKLARHSSITLTMKYYTHVLRESEISAMQRLHDLSSACLSDAQVRTIVDASGHKNSDIRAKTA